MFKLLNSRSTVLSVLALTGAIGVCYYCWKWRNKRRTSNSVPKKNNTLPKIDVTEILSEKRPETVHSFPSTSTLTQTIYEDDLNSNDDSERFVEFTLQETASRIGSSYSISSSSFCLDQDFPNVNTIEIEELHINQDLM